MGVLIILNFFVLICCFIHTIHCNPFYCVGNIPVPDGNFNEDKYNTIGYVRDCAIETARILHRKLGLVFPTEHCTELANINTTKQRRVRGGIQVVPEVRSNNVNGRAYQLLVNVEQIAAMMFHHLNTQRNNLAQREINDEDEQEIFDSINLAILRLLLTGYYSVTSNLINELRNLKRTYAEQYVHDGLFIDGQRQSEAPPNTQTILNSFPALSNAGFTFANTEVTNLEINDSVYYVPANEMALTSEMGDRITFIGSDGALNCIIVILREQNTDGVGVAHICDIGLSNHFAEELTGRLSDEEDEFEPIYLLYLIGGHHSTEALFYSVIDAFHARNVDIYLQLVCAGVFNPSTNGDAGITGAAVNMNDMTVFPAYFD